MKVLSVLVGTGMLLGLSGCFYSVGNDDTAYLKAASPVAMSAMKTYDTVNKDNFYHKEQHGVTLVTENPVSTFSVDVDTGSYSVARSYLKRGQLPPFDAIRAEEFINYFQYNYPLSEIQEQPFSVHTEVSQTPWSADTHLLRVGIKGQESPKENLPDANLVFLIDVSGSMYSDDKLPLLINAFKLLISQLDEHDTVSIVVYAGASGVILEPTSGNEKFKIISALEQLRAGGSTNGGAGVHLAYSKAQQAFISDGINRIILATDGDFNVGTVNFEALKNLVEEKRKSGIELTTLGFGNGNYNDHLMEQLADAGNGNYAYIDSLLEAKKVLVNQMSGTLKTIAKDVKIQVEFNPKKVSEYRLIGYENRILNREDFTNDNVDAGEIGAGHTVTALYEIALADSKGKRTEPLRYQHNIVRENKKTSAMNSNELAYVRLRYKKPGEDNSLELKQAVIQSSIKPIFAESSNEHQFSAMVSAFAQKLSGNKFMNDFTYESIIQQAQPKMGDDKMGLRREFIDLVALSKSLSVDKQ